MHLAMRAMLPPSLPPKAVDGFFFCGKALDEIICTESGHH
jgi:hypothetical protein